MESEAFKIRAYVTITKDLAEEYIITDLHSSRNKDLRCGATVDQWMGVGLREGRLNTKWCRYGQISN